MAQRRIHRREPAGWVVVERGTEGTYKPPEPAAEGEHFNDVTGARAPDIASVRAGLVDQMMQTGSLDEFKNLELPWNELSEKLVVAAKSAALQGVGVSPLYLGHAYMKTTADDNHDTAFEALKNIDENLVEAVWDFVFDFMCANGQVAYIERQPWYSSGAYEVHIDLNFYYDREVEAKGLGTHKDTGGDNLFVNLLFDNAAETPATEWTQDPQPLLGYKAALMKGLLPEAMVDQIREGKEALKTLDHAKGHEVFEGGTMPPRAFVSWVDELVWHSSPFLGRRPRYSGTGMRKFFDDSLDSAPASLTEYLFQMSGSVGNLVQAERQAVESKGDAFDIETCQAFLARLLKEADGRDRLLTAVEAFDWENSPSTGHIGNDIDKDDRVNTRTSHTPTDASRRPRANSVTETRRDAEKAAKDQPRRSFLRTWVRVVKAPSGKF